MRKHGEHVDAELIANELGLDVAEVTEALQYMNRQGRSLNAPIGSEGRPLSDVKSDGRMTQEQALIAREEQQATASFFGDFAEGLKEREVLIYRERMLAEEPKGLKELSEIIGVSMERVRQIEKAIFNKLQSAARQQLR